MKLPCVCVIALCVWLGRERTLLRKKKLLPSGEFCERKTKFDRDESTPDCGGPMKMKMAFQKKRKR